MCASVEVCGGVCCWYVCCMHVCFCVWCVCCVQHMYVSVGLYICSRMYCVYVWWWWFTYAVVSCVVYGIFVSSDVCGGVCGVWFICYFVECMVWGSMCVYLCLMWVLCTMHVHICICLCGVRVLCMVYVWWGCHIMCDGMHVSVR